MRKEREKGNLEKAELLDRSPMPRLSPLYIAKNISYILKTQQEYSLIRDFDKRNGFLDKLTDKNMYALLVVQDIKDINEAIYSVNMSCEGKEYSDVKAISYDDILKEIKESA